MIPEPFPTKPQDSLPPPAECPDCESSEFEVRECEQRFLYGKGEYAFDVSCIVPTYVCSRCGCEWTGPQAENIRHDAVCRRLGRLTPYEILRIREECRLSQAEFSRVTGFGEASLSRWENGVQIQNAACDRLLRLIKADYRNLDLLSQMADDAILSPR
jgi:putative zinc finger/helix-turn-helix YgiT family protein